MGYAALFIAVGLPMGAVAALLIALARSTSQTFTIVGAPLAFAGASVLGRLFFGRFFNRLAACGDYREKLETSLARIDLSQGRDAVLAEVYGHLSASLDFKDFCILIDDDQGFLRTVYAPTGGRATIERGSLVAELLERTASNIT